MIRVAALLDTHTVSGPARQLAALATGLAADDVTLTVVLFHRVGRQPSPYLAVLEQAGIPYRVIEERGPVDPKVAGQVRRILSEIDADILETHGYKPTALAWLVRTSGLRLPWLAFFHGSTAENVKIRFYQWLDRRLIRHADRIAVMSARDAELYRRLGPPVSVIYNAVIPLAEEQVGPPSRPTVTPRPSSPRIAMIGRLSPEKGGDVFLEACALVKAGGTEFEALVVGDGPERDALTRQAAKLGLAERVTFMGHCADMRPIYQAIDLLVLPSRSEGLPNVLLEGLRADRPIVATAVGAVPEVLAPPEAGIMVAPADTTALARGIELGLATRNDPARREARRVVAERFSLDHRVKAHLDLYRQLLGEATVLAPVHG